MTFSDFVHKYTNQRNPATGNFWTEAQILADSNLTAVQYVEFESFINKVFTETYIQTQQFLTADQIAAEWDKAHPPVVFTLKTPYGDVGFSDKPVTQCGVVELASIIVAAIKKG